jgi:hypothetical protein
MSMGCRSDSLKFYSKSSFDIATNFQIQTKTILSCFEAVTVDLLEWLVKKASKSAINLWALFLQLLQNGEIWCLKNLICVFTTLLHVSRVIGPSSDFFTVPPLNDILVAEQPSSEEWHIAI